MVMNATCAASFFEEERSPQNVNVLACQNIYLSPRLFIHFTVKSKLYNFRSNIKLQSKIKTFDQQTDNFLYCKQLLDVNDYPHASLISYLSSLIYYWVFMTATA